MLLIMSETSELNKYDAIDILNDALVKCKDDPNLYDSVKTLIRFFLNGKEILDSNEQAEFNHCYALIYTKQYDAAESEIKRLEEKFGHIPEIVGLYTTLSLERE